MPAIVKLSLRIAGHATSISLEAPFWDFLRQMAAQQGRPFSAVVEEIDRERREGNLSSAIRVHVLEWLMAGGRMAITTDDED